MLDVTHNLLNLLHAELANQTRNLEEKTDVLKAAIMKAVRRGLDDGVYSELAQPPEMLELAKYEMSAKRFRDLAIHTSDMMGMVSDEILPTVHAAPQSQAAGARKLNGKRRPAASGVTGEATALTHAIVAANTKIPVLALKTVTQRSALLPVIDTPQLANEAHTYATAVGRRRTSAGVLSGPTKTDRLRAALNNYLSTEEFRVIDWAVFCKRFDLDVGFSSAVTAQLATKGELLKCTQGRRVAYALHAPDSD